MILSGKRLRLVAALIGLAALTSFPIGAQEPPAATLLAPGALISSSAEVPVAWISDGEGRVAAVNLDDGQMRWRGPAKGQPLALFGEHLVVLAPPAGFGKLSLQLLNPADGSAAGGLVGALPEQVLASPDAQPNRKFAASADLSGGDFKIRWSYEEWPLQGANLVSEAGTQPARIEASGVVRVDFEANRVQAVNAQGLATRSADLLGNERLQNLEGTQFRAADDAAVQVSVAVPDEVLGSSWRWSLHERSSGRPIGDIVLPYANAPFLLRGSQLLWQSEPMTRLRAAGEYEELPSRLVAQSLSDGRELWSVALRDANYRGVLPP